MAEPDVGTQKVIFKQSELPAIKNTGEYLLAYRIKSKDGDKYSQWSKNYVVQLTNNLTDLIAASPIQYTLSQIQNTKQIQLTWTMPDSIDLNYFDIYVKWYTTATAPDVPTQNATDWIQYPKVVYGSKLELEAPASAKYAQIAVTAETFPKFAGKIIDNEATLLFKTVLSKLPIPIDGGQISS